MGLLQADKMRLRRHLHALAYIHYVVNCILHGDDNKTEYTVHATIAEQFFELRPRVQSVNAYACVSNTSPVIGRFGEQLIA